MPKRIEHLRDSILERHPDSSLVTLTDGEIQSLRARFPDIPDHIVEFFAIVGCGRIGDSRYMIYDLYSPSDLWEAIVARKLDGVVLIGDDFAGHHEAYHTGRHWEFGYVSASGSYNSHTKYKDFVEFIENWYGRG